MSRIFAVLLLCWTSADLCGGVCVHDREPIVVGLPGGSQDARTVSQASPGPELPAPPDDCFCCSRFVHPQARYEVVPVHTFASELFIGSILRPQFPAATLYHPPLGS